MYFCRVCVKARNVGPLTHRCRLFGLRDAEQLASIQRFFQNPLVADADRNQVDVEQLPFKKRLHHNVQQPWGRRKEMKLTQIVFKEAERFVSLIHLNLLLFGFDWWPLRGACQISSSHFQPLRHKLVRGVISFPDYDSIVKILWNFISLATRFLTPTEKMLPVTLNLSALQ